MDDGEIDEAPHQACQARSHVMDEGMHRCCQHRACVDWDLHELYTMSKKSERPIEKDSTMVASPINVGPILPAVVGVVELAG